MKNKIITIITTINHNVGDDFVREGILNILKKIDINISYQFIHKHSPITVFNKLEWLKNYRFEKYISKFLFPLASLILNENKIKNCDILMQSGAPVYWCNLKSHCADTEWYKPLFHLFAKTEKKIFINIGAGACQDYHDNEIAIQQCQKCSLFIKQLTKNSLITTVRDNISIALLAQLDKSIIKLPCPALFSSDKKIKKKKSVIAMNYMRLGGHYNLGDNKIKADEWANIFINTYRKLRKFGEVVIVCHNETELISVKKLVPDASFFYSDDYQKYLNFYTKVRFGIYNRVHSAFATASAGSPSSVIGNDSRARMVSEINLKSYYINDINDKKMDLIIEDLLSNEYLYASEINKIRKRAEKEYLKIFDLALNEH